MEASVQKNELIYRAVKRSKPSWLETGKATSAMFKDIGGNSVDRDGGRSREDEALANVQALMLADMAKLIYFNTEMEWVRI